MESALPFLGFVQSPANPYPGFPQERLWADNPLIMKCFQPIPAKKTASCDRWCCPAHYRFKPTSFSQPVKKYRILLLFVLESSNIGIKPGRQLPPKRD
jgi:hypothetical protein